MIGLVIPLPEGILKYSPLLVNGKWSIKWDTISMNHKLQSASVMLGCSQIYELLFGVCKSLSDVHPTL